MNEQKRPRISSALITLLVIGGLFWWWINSLPNEDPLWFLRSFTEQADWITIYWDGETHVLLPGDPGYDSVMSAFADGIANWTGYEKTVGMDETGLAAQRNDGRLLELYFSQPVKVHTKNLFSEARFFYIPLSGGHSYYHRVFSGLAEEPRIGVLNIDEEKYNILIENITKAIQTTH